MEQGGFRGGNLPKLGAKHPAPAAIDHQAASTRAHPRTQSGYGFYGSIVYLDENTIINGGGRSFLGAADYGYPGTSPRCR
jgi:hypothetical protein